LKQIVIITIMFPSKVEQARATIFPHSSGHDLISVLEPFTSQISS